MRIALKLLAVIAGLFVAFVIGFNIWGATTLGTHPPTDDAVRDASANRVVMVFGATGSAGDGLLKAAMADSQVEKIYAVTRRLSPRLEAGQASGRVEVIMHEDFSDYSSISEQLTDVNTVMWGLGASSVGMDPELYRRIHVDFPVNFVKTWLAARQQGPMAFHFITGMGTGENESQQWARDKAYTERYTAELAEGTGLRSFGHRSAWIRPTDENANAIIYIGELLMRPGYGVVRSLDLGRAMLEISARVDELPNGSLIDNRDAIEYAAAYRAHFNIDD